jgi:hypothetical protein
MVVFPKAPTKNVTGRLKLSIKAPVEETLTDGAVEGNLGVAEKDLSTQLRFSLPSGFNLAYTPVAVLEQQRDTVLKQLDELVIRGKTCKNCEQAVSDENVELVRHTCLLVCSKIYNNLESLVSLSLNHCANKDLELSVRMGQRSVKILVSNFSINVGLYSSKLEKVFESSDLNFVVSQIVDWLLFKYKDNIRNA